MSTPPITPPPPRGRSTLAKAAIAFAVTIAITFGLCTVSLMNSNSAMNGPIIPAALIIEAICIVGLIVIAAMAIAKRV
jgi:hypothetical protein